MNDPRSQWALVPDLDGDGSEVRFQDMDEEERYGFNDDDLAAPTGGVYEELYSIAASAASAAHVGPPARAEGGSLTGLGDSLGNTLGVVRAVKVDEDDLLVEPSAAAKAEAAVPAASAAPSAPGGFGNVGFPVVAPGNVIGATGSGVYPANYSAILDRRVISRGPSDSSIGPGGANTSTGFMEWDSDPDLQQWSRHPPSATDFAIEGEALGGAASAALSRVVDRQASAAASAAAFGRFGPLQSSAGDVATFSAQNSAGSLMYSSGEFGVAAGPGPASSASSRQNSLGSISGAATAGAVAAAKPASSVASRSAETMSISRAGSSSSSSSSEFSLVCSSIPVTSPLHVVSAGLLECAREVHSIKNEILVCYRSGVANVAAADLLTARIEVLRGALLRLNERLDHVLSSFIVPLVELAVVDAVQSEIGYFGDILSILHAEINVFCRRIVSSSTIPG